jgi:FMN-dependent NADH-azoreductase
LLRIAETFLGAYQNVHPSNEIETWDLWNGSLSAFGPAAAAAKMAVDLEAQPERHVRRLEPARDRAFG